MDDCLHERIFYYWRHVLYGHVAHICDEGLKKMKNDIHLIIWKALSFAVVGETEKSLEIMDSLQLNSETNFLLTVAFYFIHLNSREPNSSILENLENSIQKNLVDLNEMVSIRSAKISFLFGNIDLSFKILKNTKKTKKTLPLYGWIKLYTKDYDKAISAFEKSLNSESKDLLSLYGKAILLFQTGKYSDSIKIYNSIVLQYKFPEIYIEKLRLYAHLGKWEKFEGIFTEARPKIHHHLELYIFKSLVLFYQNSDIEKVISKLSRVLRNCVKYESKNWALLSRLAKMYGTICCRDKNVLLESSRLAQMAVDCNPNSSFCLSVLGYHYILSGLHLQASNVLQKAVEFNESNLFAIENLLRLSSESGKHDILQDQLDLYRSLQLNNLTVLMYCVKCNRLFDKFEFSTVASLIRALDDHISNFSFDFYEDELENENLYLDPIELPFENIIDFTIGLNLDVVYETLDELLYFCNTAISLFHPKINICIGDILTKLHKTIQSIPIYFYKGCNSFYQGKLFDSLNSFQLILSSLWPYRTAYCLLLIANIYSQHNERELAVQYLNEAISRNPCIADLPMAIFLMGKLNIKRIENHKIFQAIQNPKQHEFGFMSILSFIDLFIERHQYSKAMKLLQYIAKKYSLQEEKALMTILQAKLLAGLGKIERAQKQLNDLQQHSKYRELSVRALADIYRVNCNDSEKYIRTLINFTNLEPSPRHFEMLGDSYYSLHLFGEASNAYLNVVFGCNSKKLPKIAQVNNNADFNPDPERIQKCGQCLISAHRFDEAVSMFVSVVPFLNDHVDTLLYLIEQMIRIKRFSDANLCVESASTLFNPFSSINPNAFIGPVSNARFLSLKAQVLMNIGELPEAVQSFEQSISIFIDVIELREPNSYTTFLRETASNISVMAGSLFQTIKDPDKALEYYTKGFDLDPGNINALTSLVAFHKNKMENNQSIKLCMEFLENQPDNETAILLLSSLEIFNYNTLVHYLKKFLSLKPHSHRVIVRMIEVCAKIGKLQLAASYLKSDTEPGMIFANGLYNMYVGLTHQSIKCFEKILSDRKWKMSAQMSLFSLYVNPNRNYIWQESRSLTTEENISKATNLLLKMCKAKSLKEIENKPIEKNQNESDLLFTEEISNIEQNLLCAEIEKSINTVESINIASSIYQKIIKVQPTNLSARIGLASCLMREKKFIEAIPIIDSILVSKPVHETSAYFEEAYLMKAQTMLNEKKNQAAQHYIFLALGINHSCRKGLNMCAKTYEENDMHKEAAESYGQSWILSGKRDLEIGYKYALESMNANRPEDALATCREILDINPCYKDIKEKIMKPSFKMLRT